MPRYRWPLILLAVLPVATAVIAEGRVVDREALPIGIH